MKSKLLLAAVFLLAFAGCQLRPPPVVQFVSANTVIREGTSLGICVRAMAVDRESVAVRFDWGDGAYVVRYGADVRAGAGEDSGRSQVRLAW
jgi:hypothetical protein